MKYIVEKGSELFDKLLDIQKRMQESDKMVFGLAAELGADPDQVLTSSTCYVAGGVIGFAFEEKPEGWKEAKQSRSHKSFYFPKSLKRNRAVLSRIYEIPNVRRDELNKAVDFKNQFVGDKYLTSIGAIWRDDYILVEVPEEAEYNPLPGMREILSSEYKHLSESPETLREP